MKKVFVRCCWWPPRAMFATIFTEVGGTEVVNNFSRIKLSNNVGMLYKRLVLYPCSVPYNIVGYALQMTMPLNDEHLSLATRTKFQQ